MTKKEVRRAMAFEQRAIYQGKQYRIGRRYVDMLDRTAGVYTEQIELMGDTNIWAPIEQVELLEVTYEDKKNGYNRYVKDRALSASVG